MANFTLSTTYFLCSSAGLIKHTQALEIGPHCHGFYPTLSNTGLEEGTLGHGGLIQTTFGVTHIHQNFYPQAAPSKRQLKNSEIARKCLGTICMQVLSQSSRCPPPV